MTNGLRICLLEPWYGGSHKRWVDGLIATSRHTYDVLSLPARHWKWRMHGAAVTFYRQVLEGSRSYDLILVNDMMDVAVFKALIGPAGFDTPIACYFHENQLSYPVSPKDTDIAASRDLHYGFINYTSALAADVLFFNSHYHREVFLDSLPGLLGSFPDQHEFGNIENIRSKSEVLPLGMDLEVLRDHEGRDTDPDDRPLLLWNHRWEYDKNPTQFLELVLELDNRAIDFDVALLGERGTEELAGLAEVRKRLGQRILQDGPVDDFAAYARWLWRANILPVTSIQDFFGGSVVEAMYCGCHPVLPNRLSYPEHVDDPACLYDTTDEAVSKVASLITSGRWAHPCEISSRMFRYDWSQLAESYDLAFQQAAARDS